MSVACTRRQRRRVPREPRVKSTNLEVRVTDAALRMEEVAADRRVITARITTEGTRLLDGIDNSVAALHARQIGPLGERGMCDVRKLLQRLAEVRPVI